MSAIPIAINGDAISAVVVGGGQVATRKALALLAAGAKVRVIAPEISDELAVRERDDDNLAVVLREYRGPSDISNAALVIAATASREVNARVTADAHAAHRLVNVVDAPKTGSFTTMAVHRAGDVIVGVTAGSVPSAARRIRDSIALRIDARYADAIAACTELRSRMLKRGKIACATSDDTHIVTSAGNGVNRGATDSWAELHPRLIAEDFCARVEDGSFAGRVASCR